MGKVTITFAVEPKVKGPALNVTLKAGLNVIPPEVCSSRSVKSVRNPEVNTILICAISPLASDMNPGSLESS